MTITFRLDPKLIRELDAVRSTECGLVSRNRVIAVVLRAGFDAMRRHTRRKGVRP